MQDADVRIAAGALAGLVATAPMTLTMRALWETLPEPERYPAPPREIVDRTTGGGATATLLSHFAYGGFCGALFAASGRRRVRDGVAFGLGVWCASYLGLLPGLGVLKPAWTYPLRRNAMMLVAHVVWGAATALVCKELERASETTFSAGPLNDSPNAPRRAFQPHRAAETPAPAELRHPG